MMARLIPITKKNKTVEIFPITFNLKTNSSLGISKVQDFEKISKNKFVSDFEKGSTPEEVRNFLYNHIETIWKK